MESRKSFTYLIQTEGSGTIFDPYSVPAVIPQDRVTGGADARDDPTKPGIYMVTASVTEVEHSKILAAGGVLADAFSPEAEAVCGISEVQGEKYIDTMKREFLIRQEDGGRVSAAAGGKK